MKYHVFEPGRPFNADLRDHAVAASTPTTAAAIYSCQFMGLGYAEREDSLQVFSVKGELLEVVRLPAWVDSSFARAMAAAFTKEIMIETNPANVITTDTDTDN